MYKWILQLTFVQKALAESKRQGGIDAFPLAQKDILETMRDDLDKQAEELAKQKINDLFSNVDLHKIITLDKRGIILVGGEDVDASRLNNLRAEAEFLMQSDIWGLLIETPKELAQRSMFIQGDSIDDLRKGRSILYTLSAQRNILDTLLKTKQ